MKTCSFYLPYSIKYLEQLLIVINKEMTANMDIFKENTFSYSWIIRNKCTQIFTVLSKTQNMHKYILYLSKHYLFSEITNSEGIKRCRQ